MSTENQVWTVRNERLKASEQLHLCIPNITSALVASFGWTS